MEDTIRTKHYRLTAVSPIVVERVEWNTAELLLRDHHTGSFLNNNLHLVRRYHTELRRFLLKKIKMLSNNKPITEAKRQKLIWYFNELMKTNALLDGERIEDESKAK